MPDRTPTNEGGSRRASARQRKQKETQSGRSDSSSEGSFEAPKKKKSRTNKNDAKKQKSSPKPSPKTWTDEMVEDEADGLQMTDIKARIVLSQSKRIPKFSQNILLDGEHREFELVCTASSKLSEVEAEIGKLIAHHSSNLELVESTKHSGVKLFTRSKPQLEANSTSPESLKHSGELFQLSTTASWQRACATIAYRERAEGDNYDSMTEEDASSGDDDSQIMAADIECLYLDIVASTSAPAAQSDQRRRSSGSAASATPPIPDNDTTLVITVNGPAFKDPETGQYKVKVAKPSNPPTFTIEAPGPGSERVPVGRVVREAKTKAVSHDIYKRDGKNIVGK